jgi:hypothetical protein
MIVRRSEAGTHCVLAIDAERRLVEEFREVPNSEVADLLKDMRARLGTNVRILVDGTTIDGESLVRGPAAAPRGLTRPPVQILEDKGEEGQVSQIELAHAMLWDTYDRAARVQTWMLEQASAFTLDLLNNNKRLADQASELQTRYQTALAELDYMQREQKLMEGDAAASRLSRHLIEKARAEIAAANPTKPAGWIDDLIDGAAVALGTMCATRGPKGSN